MKIKKTILCLLSIACLFVAGCTLGAWEPQSEEQTIDDMTTKVILPSLENVETAALLLQSRISEFLQSPSELTLVQVQDAWKSTQEAWQKTEGIQFGPVQDERLLSKINYWPKQPSIIETFISNESEMTLSSVQEAGATKKGLPVLEYLLFDEENGNTTILNQFESDSVRLNYLNYLAQDLYLNVVDLNDLWTDEGGYASEFSMSSDALNMILNQIVVCIEDVRDTKLGTPMGVGGTTIQPEDVESQQSERSLENIKNNIESIVYLFNGSLGDETNKGLSHYLEYQELPELKKSITDQLTLVLAIIESVENPLWVAVTEETTTLQTLYDSLTDLLRLVKVDMATAINQTINFNNSDGD